MTPAESTTTARANHLLRLAPLHLAPLWAQMHTLVPPAPAPRCVPWLWRYADVKPVLMEAGQLISAEEAVRRVLILENPALAGSASVTQSLYAGLQLILPGEVAPAHRHVQSALRFVVEGRGAYTTVGGERTTMCPGDFVITPSWDWHDHGNEGRGGECEPVIWLDGLDIPLVRFLDAGFAENAGEQRQAVSRPEGASYVRFGYNMAPVKHSHSSSTSPIFSYPYARSREALFQLERQEALDPWHGWKLRYVNPLTGGAPMPTMATFLQLLPGGFEGQPHRSTDGTVYSVVEGRGSAAIGGQRFRFEPRDTFVVPSWAILRLMADEHVVLFSFSDRPVQESIGIHREAFLPSATTSS